MFKISYIFLMYLLSAIFITCCQGGDVITLWCLFYDVIILWCHYYDVTFYGNVLSTILYPMSTISVTSCMLWDSEFKPVVLFTWRRPHGRKFVIDISYQYIHLSSNTTFLSYILQRCGRYYKFYHRLRIMKLKGN